MKRSFVLAVFASLLLMPLILEGHYNTTSTSYNIPSNNEKNQHYFTESSSIIYVPDNYTKIQDAINNASDGDTIFVKAGTYYENIVVNKRVSLVGENRSTAIIDGNMTATVVAVTADIVTISLIVR